MNLKMKAHGKLFRGIFVERFCFLLVAKWRHNLSSRFPDSYVIISAPHPKNVNECVQNIENGSQFLADNIRQRVYRYPEDILAPNKTHHYLNNAHQIKCT